MQRFGTVKLHETVEAGPQDMVSQPERDRLADLEAKIVTLIRNVQGIGLALREIRDSRLYRDRHATFEDYIVARWTHGKAWAYRCMAHAGFVAGAASSVQLVTPEQVSGLDERQTRAIQAAPIDHWARLAEVAVVEGLSPKELAERAATAKEASKPPPPPEPSYAKDRRVEAEKASKLFHILAVEVNKLDADFDAVARQPYGLWLRGEPGKLSLDHRIQKAFHELHRAIQSSRPVAICKCPNPHQCQLCYGLGWFSDPVLHANAHRGIPL